MLTLHHGHCIDQLRAMDAESVDCVVTSPPYWGLRDYGIAPSIWDCVRFRPAAGLDYMVLPSEICCLGLERNPWAFVGHMVQVFREVRRVLKPSGTCWINLGDSYCGSGRGGQSNKSSLEGGKATHAESAKARHLHASVCASGNIGRLWVPPPDGMKEKNLAGIPWRVAFALQADGWYLRQDIIWSKPNPMPESVTDRCTKAHEYLFLLSKSQRYHFDCTSIMEALQPSSIDRLSQDVDSQAGSDRVPGKSNGVMKAVGGSRKSRARGIPPSHNHLSTNHLSLNEHPRGAGRNKRSVWTVATVPYKDAHFATFPPDLIRPAIRAGCPRGGIVLDPFGGSGTTGQVAIEEGRRAVLIEANPAYLPMIRRRTEVTPPLDL